jgi:hypothetical protein
MPDFGAPVRIVTYYVVELLAVYMLMSLWYSGYDVCIGSVVCLSVCLSLVHFEAQFLGLYLKVFAFRNNISNTI